MVANPMQKKARNSFLLGMIITLVVCIIVGVLFYVIITGQEKNREKEEGTLKYVYKLAKDVEAGNEITDKDVEAVAVTSKVVPADAFASKTKTSDSKGKEVWETKKFNAEGSEKKRKAKVNLKAGTILAAGSVYEEEGSITADIRYVEYNMLSLPTNAKIGSFVDIRIKIPNGQDLIVVSKKKIKSILGNTVGLELSEGEILMMESAIVEAYIMKASKLYVTQYIEPGLQTAATYTYVPTEAVRKLIAANSNIVETARTELARLFTDEKRSWIDNEVSKYALEENENIETRLKEEIENAKAAREAYLSGLTSY